MSTDRAKTKNVTAVLDYFINWAAWLVGDPAFPVADTIVTSVWTVDDPSLTIASMPFTPTIAYVWLSGGTYGRTYLVTNTITTTAGRTETESLLVTITKETQ